VALWSVGTGTKSERKCVKFI